MFRFAAPWMLLLLPVALAAGWALARRRRRTDARLTLPRAASRAALAVSPWVRLDRLMPWVRGLVLVLLVVAMARPQAGSSLENVSTLAVDIVVALDVSGSMRAEDFRPDNRLEVARRTVRRFVEGRPSDRVGLVVFAALATTRCPVTQDHTMLLDTLEQVGFAPREEDGTALGMGLATALNRLRGSKARSKLVVLVTDGVNNRGEIGPMAAAEAARALGVKVYTVGVGTEGEAPIPIDFGPGGRRYVMQQVEIDEELLREIANLTDARYFRATDAEGLEQVFRTIDGLEKTEIESKIRIVYSELFHLVLFPAALLLLLERALIGARLRRIP